MILWLPTQAYNLEPSSNQAGKSIVNLLMKAGEDQRDKLTIIFAGYKEDIENKLYAFNPGMKSRFKDLILEDFKQPELMEIWVKMAHERSWRCGLPLPTCTQKARGPRILVPRHCVIVLASCCMHRTRAPSSLRSCDAAASRRTWRRWRRVASRAAVASRASRMLATCATSSSNRTCARSTASSASARDRRWPRRSGRALRPKHLAPPPARRRSRLWPQRARARPALLPRSLPRAPLPGQRSPAR